MPAGYFSDRLGRKPSLLLSTSLLSLAVLGLVIWRSLAGLCLVNVLMGLAQSLAGVTAGLFLMENGGEEERTYLFSFDVDRPPNRFQ